MKDKGSAGATVENTHEPLAEEAGRKAGLADLSEGAWAKNFNGWAMEASPAGIGFIRICNGRPNVQAEGAAQVLSRSSLRAPGSAAHVAEKG